MRHERESHSVRGDTDLVVDNRCDDIPGAFKQADMDETLHGHLDWMGLRAARLFARTGFVINLYDFYLASMVIEGKKCTVLWHVDGRKILAHTERQ